MTRRAPRGGVSALVPAAVTAYAGRGPAWAAWVEALPRLLGELLDEWELEPVAASLWGETAMVLPVRGPLGDAVLKVGFPHEEAEHEGLALQRLGGAGAVRLLRADPHRWALLLERLPGPDLREVGDLEACEIVGGLYARLHVPAPPQLRPVSASVGRWAEALAALPRSAPVPRRLVEQAAALALDLAADPATDGVLVHTDLHYDNVLAGTREPWLVIDPKPLSGDPHLEPAPMLWNRWDEVVASGDVRSAVRRRFHTIIDTAGLEEDRAREWVVLRMLVNVLWSLEDPTAAPPTDWITRCVSVAKAVQD